MLEPVYLRKFEGELEKAKKRGKDIEKIKAVMKLLVKEVPLPAKNRNHKLKGEYAGYWECHVEPDSLLVTKDRHGDYLHANGHTLQLILDHPFDSGSIVSISLKKGDDCLFHALHEII